jgi:hypothetical protein
MPISDDPDDVRSIRNSREVEQGLRQFLKLESGNGNSRAFRRGHVWNFSWNGTPGEPERVRRVKKLMDLGWPFADAFDHVDGHPDSEPLPGPEDCLCGT